MAESNIVDENGTGIQTINLLSFGVAIGTTVSTTNLFARGDINGDYSNENFNLTFVNADGEGTDIELTGLQTPLNGNNEDDTFRKVTSPIDVTVMVVDIGNGVPDFVVQGITGSGVNNNAQNSGVNGVDYYFDIAGVATVDYVVITGDVPENTVSETEAGDYDDRVTVTQNVQNNAEISTDAGDDTITIGGKLEGIISIGAGNDTVTISGEVKDNASIDMGDGSDNLMLSGYSSSDVDISNLDFSVSVSEFIQFGDDNTTYQFDAASNQYILTATAIEALNYVTFSG
jgi:hypothetical protein